MAQTRYDPDGAYLYAKALREQGTNPIVSWFTDSQGGGLNNWIQDQGNQIATRTRNDILRELTDDPTMVERVRTAQNEGRDFRKELLGDRYFVNPHDTVLNRGIDNIKTKSENRLRKKFSEALAESLNADKYKADGTTAEALAESLGYKNLSPELLTELKEGEQSALKKRYENQIYREIAQKRLTNPDATVDDIISNYRDKYGLNLNPDTYLDPENETMQKFVKSGLQSVLNDMFLRDVPNNVKEEYIKRLKMVRPEYADILNEANTRVETDKYNNIETDYINTVNYLVDKAKQQGMPVSVEEIMRKVALNFVSEGKVSEKIMNEILTSDNTRRTLTAESKTAIDKQLEALQATRAVYNNKPAVKIFEDTKEKSAIAANNADKFTQPALKNAVKSKLQSALQVKQLDDKVFTHFVNWLVQAYPGFDTSDGIKQLQENMEIVDKVANEFGAIYNTQTAQNNEELNLRAAQFQRNANNMGY